MSLSSAKSYSPKHESFFKGYRLRFIIGKAKSNKYLYVYEKSSRGNDVFIVIPHIVWYYETGFDGGVYDCPQFLNWLRQEIEPLFLKNN